MKPLLFVGDSHLSRFEIAYKSIGSDFPYKAEFLSAPGPTHRLVRFKEGQLDLVRDDEYLANHPQAAQYDFLGWFDAIYKRHQEIEATSGLDVNCYAAVIVVSFQIFNPEVWPAAAVAREKGQISTSVWRKHVLETYMMHHGWKPSYHFILLDQIRSENLQVPIFSLATPARSQASEFPRNLLLPEETARGTAAFRNSELEYRRIILEKHNSTLISYPQALLSTDGMSTKLAYQMNQRDLTHLNLAGSEIWCRHAMSNLVVNLPTSP